MSIGIIIAAGDQSRFESDIPKFMMPYKESDILTVNIQMMNKQCSEVYVFTNHSTYSRVIHHLNRTLGNRHKIKVIPINSGNGCGDAVIRALQLVDRRAESAIVKWGDAIHDESGYYEDFEDARDDINVHISAELAESPYTILDTHDDNIIHDVRFNKDGEIGHIESGWHDLSIFFINSINQFIVKNAHWARFTEPCIFLKSLIYGDNSVKLIKSKMKSKSFNTIDEYEAII